MGELTDADVIKNLKNANLNLKNENEKMFAALKESKECWDAAYAEGFPQAMNDARNGDATKLIELLDNRLLYALAPLVEVMP
jgi:hypothetical protein